jgi:hypothetical protein
MALGKGNGRTGQVYPPAPTLVFLETPLRSPNGNEYQEGRSKSSQLPCDVGQITAVTASRSPSASLRQALTPQLPA